MIKMGSKWGKNKTCSFSAQLILIESLRSSFQNFIFQIGYDISKLNVFMNYHFWLRWTVLRAHFKFSYLMLVMIYQDRSFLCTINAHVNLNLRGLVFFKLRSLCEAEKYNIMSYVSVSWLLLVLTISITKCKHCLWASNS